MRDARLRPLAAWLAALFLILLGGPAAAAPPSRGEDEGKSLAETVRGTEKTAGLLTFYRSPGKLWLEVPPSLLGSPLGFSVTLVNAIGDWLPRGEGFDNSLVTWRRMGDRLILRKENRDF